MIKLTIKNKDGSEYWVKHFNTMADANAWAKEEKSRPYWDKSRVIEIVEQKEPEIVLPAKPDFEAIKQSKKQALDGVKSIAELKTWIQDHLL